MASSVLQEQTMEIKIIKSKVLAQKDPSKPHVTVKEGTVRDDLDAEICERLIELGCAEVFEEEKKEVKLTDAQKAVVERLNAGITLIGEDGKYAYSDCENVNDKTITAMIEKGILTEELKLA